MCSYHVARNGHRLSIIGYRLKEELDKVVRLLTDN